MANRIGQHIGNYRLVRLLGQGAFADVYLGEHRYLKSQAAVKLLRTHIDQTAIENFLHEAQILARLRNPHIIMVHDFSQESTDGTPFLVMDYAPNGSMRNLCPRGNTLPISKIVSCVQQIAHALQQAHDEKIVHRDIKSENLLLGSSKEILLSDFGIAAVAQSTASWYTQSIAGTPYYMAPEQFRGKPQPASDQYALAVVVYEWLCGSPPFTEGDFIQLGFQHTYVSPPSLREKVPTIPPKVEEMVLKALAKDPQQRFTSMQAFAGALEQASHSPQLNIAAPLLTKPVAPPTSQPSRSPDLNTLYRESVKARSQGDLEQTALLWQQILDRDPQFQSGILALQMKRLSEELVPWRVKRLRDQAEQAHALGEWGQEIGAWQALLRLEPNNDEIKARIVLAEQHQKYAWMYEIASQFVQEQALSEATTQLEMLWQEDPEYGDPAELAQKVGITSVPPRLKKAYFDKFTLGARRVLSLAQEEAQRLQHNYIGTEHLLLGLVRGGGGRATIVLSNLGVELNKVRSAVESMIGRGDRPGWGEIDLTPRATKVIEFADDEARRLKHNYIGTEHLLLGLVREGGGITPGVLESLGVNLEKLRTQTIQALS